MAETGVTHVQENEPAAPSRQAKNEPPWHLFLSGPERAEYTAAKAGVCEWRQLQLDEPRVRKQYLAVPDQMDARLAAFWRLRAAVSTTVRLRQRAEKRARAGLPATPRAPDRPLVSGVPPARTGRAQLDTAQDGVHDLCRHGLQNARHGRAYLAAPDPKGMRAATYGRPHNAAMRRSGCVLWRLTGKDAAAAGAGVAGRT